MTEIQRDYDKGCSKCGYPVWLDDDLHWWWCRNPRCPESWEKPSPDKWRLYQQELAALTDEQEALANERGAD
jgi:hypothetical protein